MHVHWYMKRSCVKRLKRNNKTSFLPFPFTYNDIIFKSYSGKRQKTLELTRTLTGLHLGSVRFVFFIFIGIWQMACIAIRRIIDKLQNNTLVIYTTLLDFYNTKLTMTKQWNPVSISINWQQFPRFFCVIYLKEPENCVCKNYSSEKFLKILERLVSSSNVTLQCFICMLNALRTKTITLKQICKIIFLDDLEHEELIIY